MNSIGFFTPVIYDSRINKTKTEKAAVFVDHYFWLGGKRAAIIPSETKVPQTHMINPAGKAPFIRTALKVLSYCTVVIPLLMLVVKAALRCSITIPERPNRISPYAIRTLGIAESPRGINLAATLTPRHINVLDAEELKSLNATMIEIALDIIDQINAYFVEYGSDLENATIKFDKIPGKKDERKIVLSSVYARTTMDGTLASTPEDSSVLDVVMKVLKNKGYINNYFYTDSKNNQVVDTLVVAVPK